MSISDAQANIMSISGPAVALPCKPPGCAAYEAVAESGREPTGLQVTTPRIMSVSRG